MQVLQSGEVNGLERPRRLSTLLGGGLRAHSAALIVLVLGLAITAASWEFTRRFGQDYVSREFDSRVREFSDEVRERMADFESMLHASRGFILAVPQVSRAQWLLFQDTQQPADSDPGTLGIGFAVEVQAKDLNDYVRSVRAVEGDEYRVWPEGARARYAPIRYTASHNRHFRALGMDMYSEPRRRAAMERARDTGLPSLSEPVMLVGSESKQARTSVILSLAVYDSTLPDAPTVAERRAALSSYVYCPILTAEFLQRIARKITEQHVAARITEEDGAEIFATSVDESVWSRSTLSAVKRQNMYGRNWTIEFRALPGFKTGIVAAWSDTAAIAGIVISLLLVGIVWTLTTTRLRAEMLAGRMTVDLRQSEERFRSLTQLSADWYWEQDDNFRFTAHSGAEGSATLDISQVRGKTRWELPVVGMTEEDWQAHRALLSARQPFQDAVFRRYDRAGVLRHISVSGEPFFDENGVFKGYRGIGRDITEQIVAEERVQYLAYHDSLTGLPNRSSFGMLLNHQINQARRHRKSLALLFVDLDHFKEVNDTLGHDAGDALLKQVAMRLKRAVRQNDTVGRWGGDEFVVLLEDIGAAANAGNVAGKILADVAAAADELLADCRITPSIGISLYPQDGADEQTLIKHADTAMYQAKELGRNNYQFYSPQRNGETGVRLRLESNLRQALDRREFVLHYQPKANLLDGAISGMEALLRWQLPNGELVSPANFVPLLESTGLIVPVGEWILHSVCAQIAEWEKAGIEMRPVAVNLSARQFEQKDFGARATRIVAEHGVAPGLIQLEITESMLMKNPGEVAATLRGFVGFGVRLSVDDFGTGYSSLGYLKRFPLNELKIDRSFIQDVASDPDSAAIVLAMIGLAHNLQLRVVAEGVETAGQLMFLRSHGCDEMQGYYFSRPLPAAEATQVLHEDRHVAFPVQEAADQPGILIVDDAEADLELMRRALKSLSARIFVARNAREAFSVLAEHAIHVLVSDQNMPSISGVALMTSVRQLYPRVVRVLMSGAGAAEDVAQGINAGGIHKYLHKEWTPERILAEVEEALRMGKGS